MERGPVGYHRCVDRRPAPEDLTHRRPPGVDDATVEAVGKVGEAVERLERARGRLFDFHQLMGRLDLQMGEAAELLRDAGHGELADLVEREVVGRNVLDGRWTFQVVEEFDDLYYGPVRDVERVVREALVGGRRHVMEAEMKERRRSGGRPAHEAAPAGTHAAAARGDGTSPPRPS